MSQLKRKSTKIDLQVKLYALEMYNKGNRVSLISKQIGYSEPTIKYWINHSENILNQEGAEESQTTLNGNLPELDLYNDDNASIKRITKNCDISGDLRKYYGKRLTLTDASPKKRTNGRLSKSLYESYRDHSATSSKETESMALVSVPKVAECHSVVARAPRQSNGGTKANDASKSNTNSKISANSHSESDFRNFKTEYANCQQAIEELVEFIACAKKVVNRASNFLYQMQDTMNEYEIRRKVKFENQ